MPTKFPDSSLSPRFNVWIFFGFPILHTLGLFGGYNFFFGLAAAVLIYIAYIFLLLRARNYLNLFVLVLALGFPAYAANPYVEGFDSIFGYLKYLLFFHVLWLLISEFRLQPGVNKVILMLPFLSIIGLLVQEIVLGYGVASSEFIFFFLFLAFLHIFDRKYKNEAESQISSQALARDLIFNISAGLFITQLLVFMFGFEDIRAGETKVAFYGHWLSLLVILSILQVFECCEGFDRVVKIFFLAFSSFLVISSFQSSFYILVIIAAGLFFLKKGLTFKGFSVAMPVVIATTIAFLVTLSSLEQSSWLYLKLNQVVSVVTGDFGSFSNSLLIRAAQAESIMMDFMLHEFIIGRGVGSYYLPVSDLWDVVQLHSATMPEDEVNAGLYRYVHEPLLLFFKWFGFFSIIIFCYLAKRFFRKLNVSSVFLLFGSFLLFPTSLHTAFLYISLLTIRLRSHE